jgi:predicted transglutaminase-like cysteine proteinase
MRLKKLAAAFALAAGMVVLSAPGGSANDSAQKAANDNNHGPSLSMGGRTWADGGHRNFCNRNPSDCLPDPHGVRRVVLNDYTRKMLDEVNRHYNRQITYQLDEENYGREDYWNYPVNDRGDCEDYALAKRKELIARGWPPSSVLIAKVQTEDGGWHAILVARTDKGDYVLDNRFYSVMRWDALPYDWDSIQDPDNPRKWVSVRGGHNRPHKQVFAIS